MNEQDVLKILEIKLGAKATLIDHQRVEGRLVDGKMQSLHPSQVGVLVKTPSKEERADFTVAYKTDNAPPFRVASFNVYPDSVRKIVITDEELVIDSGWPYGGCFFSIKEEEEILASLAELGL
ncbi:hypothetical protein COT75_02025 [Candidatus Beckwithbacteria bacterium CG10_big_fil_rev_8_21_14_0_10_34_10]|uniref:Uncharacterized protein n=1 Tax=Candidatus Beckwithbacteria bacterium CG10_big_fil_rev_8_21_14_0_10_34_10 TaxID=1974495 RepID=A0A2H0W9N2_9BACT|nr:MAG: hypothetical protein COT75_02025 [Candidatus Beckwithbacteria bacterium CG10_big_fil_rev_8_21_14_0_10_34_10]